MVIVGYSIALYFHSEVTIDDVITAVKDDVNNIYVYMYICIYLYMYICVYI